jgi:anti-sigma factor (TIGR02949 family)
MQDNPRHVDCEEAMRCLWDYLDGELSPAEERAVRTHIAICTRCYPRMAFDKAFLGAIAATRRAEHASPALRARVISALRSARHAT